jgi:ornithine carbamoyltransferase
MGELRHLVSMLELSPKELAELLDRAAQMKTAHQAGRRELALAGRTIALLFEKPSLRTRVSFEAAVAQLGGTAIFIQGSEVGLGKRESIADFARVISQYIDSLIVRVYRHETVEQLARYATVPVINGLSDWEHPCQALGDLLTMRELFGQLAGRRVAFVGDGNNVARSLAIGCVAAGVQFTLAAPRQYQFQAAFLEQLDRVGDPTLVRLTEEPAEAVKNADIIYTDVWTSMGQDAEREARLAAFSRYQVNDELLQHAPPHARVMHCLPARRGEEITDEIIDGPRSVVVQQAANRMHAQKALMVWLLGPERYPIRAAERGD